MCNIPSGQEDYYVFKASDLNTGYFNPCDVLIYFAILHTWLDCSTIRKFFNRLPPSTVQHLQKILLQNQRLTKSDSSLKEIAAIINDYLLIIDKTSLPKIVKDNLKQEIINEFSWIRNLNLMDLIFSSQPHLIENPAIIRRPDLSNALTTRYDNYRQLRETKKSRAFGAFLYQYQLEEVLVFFSRKQIDLQKCKTLRGSSVMHFIAAYGRPSLAEFFASNGGALDCKDISNLAPLLYAVRNHNIEMYHWLRKNKCAIDDICSKQRGRIHYAVVSGSLTLLQLFLAEPGFIENNKNLPWKKIYNLSQRMIDTLLYQLNQEDESKSILWHVDDRKKAIENYRQITVFIERYLAENFTLFNDPDINLILNAKSPFQLIVVSPETIIPPTQVLPGDSPREQSQLLDRTAPTDSDEPSSQKNSPRRGG